MSSPSPTLPPDQAERDRIVAELDRTLLVEAAAGTGKTTSMIARMVALLAAGKCPIETLAAVTFTRKSAAELRARFQVELERACRAVEEPELRARLTQALSQIERCFIGTIHSFCGRLLRERPVEAGVELNFEELDEQVDARLRREAWQDYVAYLFASDDPRLAELDALGITGLITRREEVLAELNELGLDIDDLASLFQEYVKYPDVEEWPAEKVELPDLAPTLAALADYVTHMESLIPTFPQAKGSDKLMEAYERVVRLYRKVNLTRTAEVMGLLAQFRTQKPTQKMWPGKRDQAKKEEARWLEFQAVHAQPLVNCWLEKRYEAILRTVRPAMAVYDRLRRLAGGLNFQDLLIEAARLLRDKPAVRRYFRRRYSHVLVDEFQDTDPVQAEMLLLLAADNPAEQNWRDCRPVPGSLFVVGDPKQSIYRFRRADIVTYSQVRDIIVQSGGDVIPLTANFRTLAPLVEWVNGVFTQVFPATATQYAPANTPMQVGRPVGTPGELAGLKILPAIDANIEAIAQDEAQRIARAIRFALDTGQTIPRSPREVNRGLGRAEPGDFLILTRKRKHLALYAQALAELGIPHEVTGGYALSQLNEVASLAKYLSAIVEPENSVALVAVLRGELFGVSDPALYAFRQQKGAFDYRVDPPADLSAEAAAIAPALAMLKRHASWLRQLPPVSAFERMSADLGLVMQAAAEGGSLRAGSMAKVFEQLRLVEQELVSTADLVDYLRDLLDKNSEFDGIPARPHPGTAVRLMNLHKAKGLEAPVVFLSDVSSSSDRGPRIHIDRTGDKPRGYAAIQGPSKDFRPGPLLARPKGWEHWAAVEVQFLDAEEKRLMYVAATRAGTQLTIVQRPGGKHPWQLFTPFLASAVPLEDPGPQTAPAGPETTILPEEADQARSQWQTRYAHARTPTFSTMAAKRFGISTAGKPSPDTAKGSGKEPADVSVEVSLEDAARQPSSEHGTEWGTVIHLLLEAAQRDPQADLAPLARQRLEDEGLAPKWADLAMAAVRAVMNSQIWKRSLTSPQRLAEVPFQTLVKVDELPTVLRGVIDLIFREADGWVLVDYKTDAAAKESTTKLVAHYRGQLEGYARVWEEITGEKVKERGLYFTAIDRYVTL